MCRYGAVVRGPGAYVPPGARQAQSPQQAHFPPPTTLQTQTQTPTPTVDITPAPSTNNSNANIPTIAKQEGNRSIPIIAPGSPGVAGSGTSAAAPAKVSYLRSIYARFNLGDRALMVLLTISDRLSRVRRIDWRRRGWRL